MQSFLACFANQRKNITTVVCKSKPMSKFEAEDWLEEKCPKCEKMDILPKYDGQTKYLIETGLIMSKLLLKADADDLRFEFIDNKTSVNIEYSEFFQLKAWSRPYVIKKFINHIDTECN